MKKSKFEQKKLKTRKKLISNKFAATKSRPQPKDIDAERHPEEQMYNGIYSDENESKKIFTALRRK